MSGAKSDSCRGAGKRRMVRSLAHAGPSEPTRDVLDYW